MPSLSKHMIVGTLALMSLAARSSSPTPSGHTSEAPTSLYAGISLRDLEKLEYDRPDDTALKLELARQYWCQGDRGLAVEHWRWLDQNHGPDTEKALSYLSRLKNKSPSLATELCTAYPQKTL